MRKAKSHLVNLPNTIKIAGDLGKKFNLNEGAVEKLSICLPYLRPERFALPYDEGVALLTERAFGAELRAWILRPGLTPREIFALDRHTFNLAGTIEFADLHGVERAMVTIFVSGFMEGQGALGDDLISRVEPIQQLSIMPIVNEALAILFEDIANVSPTKCDFENVGKYKRRVPKAGTTADFIMSVYDALGWAIPAMDLANSYDWLITSPWRTDIRR